jgi:predicted transcriptional regulator of viral defense system
MRRIERLMLRTRGYFTTEEVADACGVDPVEAQAKLDHLFTGGHIRRAAVQRVPNGDVELTLWAMNVADFLAEDE